MTKRGAVATIVVVMIFVGAARAARACTTLRPPPVLTGIPADGASAVPTDVRPFFDAGAAWLDDDQAQAPAFQLASSSGETVPVTYQRTYSATFELIPASPLAPLTTYTLSGHWTSSISPDTAIDVHISFTTAAGPLAEPPAPPVASMQHYAMAEPVSTCAPYPHGSCIYFQAGTVLEATYLDGLGQSHFPEVHTGPFLTNLSGVDQGTDFQCVSLRTRASNGTLSDPISLCGADSQTLNLSGNGTLACTTQGISYTGGQIAVSSPAGCALAGEAAPRSWPAAGLLLAAHLFVRAIRSRRNRG